LVELIHEFSKVTGYKINVQKSVAFLYTNKESAEREIKESIPFTIAPKSMIPRNNIPCSWMGGTNIVKIRCLCGSVG